MLNGELLPAKKPDIDNISKDTSKNETPKFLHPNAEKEYENAKKHYRVIAVDENGKPHSINSIHDINIDDNFEAFLKWLMQK